MSGFENKTIFVTGAAGFIGAFLSAELLRQNEKVHVVGIDSMNDYYEVSLKEYRLDMLEKLAAEESMILATVVAKAESNSPLSGRKMLLDNAGTVYGSLGHAGAEAAVQEIAEAVQQEGYPRILEYSGDEGADPIRILVEPIN